jgi:pyruvate dehydrogenase E2 component (dihydrolipoamide acetyltransferase)
VTELTMPKLSDSMERGTILTWLKNDGDQVKAGEDLLEIETDKATVTHPAEATGRLEIIAPEGSTLPVGAPIAQVGGAPDVEAPQPGSDEAATPEPQANGGERAVKVGPVEDVLEATGDAPVRATPLARRAASAHGVSLRGIAGTGPLGRITRDDVLGQAGIAPRAAAGPPAPDRLPAPARSPAPDRGNGVETVEPTRLQSLIARRMAEAKATIPHFQVQTEVAMDAAVAFRAQLKDLLADAPSLNDLVIRATALALRDHPLANGSYRDGKFDLHAHINIGIAVAADHALVVPTIHDADQKSLGTIAAESRQLAQGVRDGTITPPELSGPTFTVSNLGMYGMTSITPVINPPQAAILGVGSIRNTLARVEGEIVDRRLMTITLSCDHRILYGADAAEFLARIRELLEAPLLLTL